MQRYSLDIIGTHLEISLHTEKDLESIFRTLEKRLTDFEARFSRFISANWLFMLNRDRRGFLDTDAQSMLSCMLDIAKKTQGYFDPTVGKRLTELGYGDPRLQGVDYRLQITDSRLEREDTIGQEKYGDYRDIEIIGDEVILHGDILLEFGGVGKGYLIDVIREMIESHEWIHSDSRYLIDFGGDLYARGAWKVGLESPYASDEVIGTIVLDDTFLACSAGTKRKWGSHHHLIDPKTGESSREVIASYIEGSSGMTTDAYATALCVMPWTLACETLESTPEISGVIVRHDGILYRKEGSRSEIFT